MRPEPGQGGAVVAAVLVAIGAGAWACSAGEAAKEPGGGRTVDAGAPDGSRASPDDAGADGGSLGVVDTVEGRPYATFVPSRYDAKTATPLVLQLHGYTWDAKRIDAYLHMTALAEQRTFLVVTPDGTADFAGNQFWDATDSCCNFGGKPVDDSGYLAAVLVNVKAHYNVDPRRVFVVGHSNGSFMAHRMACDHADTIAAIAAFSGGTFLDTTKCSPTAPVAVLQIHGDADEVNPYEGGTTFPLPGLPRFPSAKETVASWAEKNGCSTVVVQGERLDVDATLAGSETEVARYECTQGAAELWTIEGGSHEPTLQPTFRGMVYDFLMAHPKAQ